MCGTKEGVIYAVLWQSSVLVVSAGDPPEGDRRFCRREVRKCSNEQISTIATKLFRTLYGQDRRPLSW